MPQFTLVQLEDQVWSRLDRNYGLYTEPEVRDKLNEALCLDALACGWWQDTVVIPGGTRPGRYVYDVPWPLIATLQVYFEGKTLLPTNWQDNIQCHPNWFSETTATTQGPIASWCRVGLTKVAIWPADAKGGRELKLIGIAEPPLLVNQSDVIVIEDERTPGLVDYAAGALQAKEGGFGFQMATASLRRYYKDVATRQVWKKLEQPDLKGMLEELQPQAVGNLAVGNLKG